MQITTANRSGFNKQIPITNTSVNGFNTQIPITNRSVNGFNTLLKVKVFQKVLFRKKGLLIMRKRFLVDYD